MKYLMTESQMGKLLRKYMESMDLNIKLYKVYDFDYLPLVFRRLFLRDELYLAFQSKSHHNDYFKRFGTYVLESGNRKYVIQRFYNNKLNDYSFIITSDEGFNITEEQLLSQLSLEGFSDSFSEIFDLLLLYLDVRIIESKRELVREDRVDKIIYEYIDEMYRPNFTNGEREQWGPETYKFFEIELDMLGYFVLYRDGKPSYRFFRNKYFRDAKSNTLLILPDIENELEQLFGDRWKPIFIKWFEDGTGVKVKALSVARL